MVVAASFGCGCAVSVPRAAYRCIARILASTACCAVGAFVRSLQVKRGHAAHAMVGVTHSASRSDSRRVHYRYFLFYRVLVWRVCCRVARCACPPLRRWKAILWLSRLVVLLL